MYGKIDFEIKNNRTSFKFTLERNITILNGNSATGKSTLIDMVRSYEQEGRKSNVHLKCNKECRVLEGREWAKILDGIHDSIVFIDEGNKFIKTTEFASMLINSDNYYVIATRDPLFNLPYSINSIFEIITKGKKHILKKMYDKISINDFSKAKYDLIITEDSKSGFEFFCEVSGSTISADGKSNIIFKLKNHSDKNSLVVADGAALGSEIALLVQYKNKYDGRILLMLPESFEWMILKSGLIQMDGLKEILQNPSDYIYCEKYVSWERYFTDLLIDSTKDNALMKYDKGKLADYYKNSVNIQKILQSIKG